MSKQCTNTHTQETHTHTHTSSKQFDRIRQTKALRIQELCGSARGTCISTPTQSSILAEACVFAAVPAAPVYTLTAALFCSTCESKTFTGGSPRPSVGLPAPCPGSPPPAWTSWRFRPAKRKPLLATDAYLGGPARIKSGFLDCNK